MTDDSLGTWAVARSTISGPTGRSDPKLHGRRSECSILDRLLADIRDGGSQPLVLHGEAGIGKSALLRYIAQRASDCRIARAVGVESEMELPFAGLHQLCSPFLSRIDQLPVPQREALSTAFGLSLGDPPDRFLVGLAVLNLLAHLSEDKPLVCLVDDAQWLDRISMQSLAFVARRLQAEPIAMVFSLRELSDDHELAPFPQLAVEGVNDTAAQTLLGEAIRGPVDHAIRDRIVAETRGNPLALLELPHGMTPAQLAGGFGLPDTMPMGSRIEQGFLRRLQTLPAPTRHLLVAAAVEPTGDLALLLRALEQLGIETSAAIPAQEAGLIELKQRVLFRHPLVRSAVCRAAGVGDLQGAHRALADVTNPEIDPDRRAWHRAQAAVGPDELVAGELQRSADRAQTRGGLAAAGAFLERAAELTPDPTRKAHRALMAAQAKLGAGAFESALSLLAVAETGPLDEPRRARIDLLRAKIALASSRGAQAPTLLLAAATNLEPLDVELARDTYLDAISATVFAGRLTKGPSLAQLGKAALAAPASPQPRMCDVLLDGLATLFTDSYDAAVPTLRRALLAFRADDIRPAQRHSLWLASVVAADLWDDEGWHQLATRSLSFAREAGELSELPPALGSRTFVDIFAGDLTTAASLVSESQAVREIIGSYPAPYGRLGLAAWTGDESAAELIDAKTTEVIDRGDGIGVTIVYWAKALLCNGSGRYSDALVAAQQAARHPEELVAANWGLVELIEAAARSGRTDIATTAVATLSEMTSPSGTN